MSNTIGTMGYDNLIAGSQKNLVTRPAPIEPALIFSRGQLLGRVTATGRYELVEESNVAAYNGYGIATEAVDSSLGVVQTDVFVEGEFSENAVVFGYADTADDWREQLAAVGIYLRKTVSTVGV